jgi:hypothetical protein
MSKRELQIKYSIIPPLVIEYNNIVNTSNIIPDMQSIAAFFSYEVSFKLIFRASNHGFKVNEFHDICDSY